MSEAQLRAYIKANRDKKSPRGYYAEAVASDPGVVKGGWQHWTKSVRDPKTGLGLKKQPGHEGWLAASNPQLRKRSDIARMESMSRRLWKAVQTGDYLEQQELLRRMQGSLWQQGKPIAFEDMKQVAAEVMRDALRRKGQVEHVATSHRSQPN